MNVKESMWVASDNLLKGMMRKYELFTLTLIKILKINMLGRMHDILINLDKTSSNIK